MKRLLLFFGFSLGSYTLPAQDVVIKPIYTRDSSYSVYSFKLANTSADSIVVLHAQVFVEPPFINEYAQYPDIVNGKKVFRIQIGKSNNPRIPERFTAIRAIVPGDTLELLFSLTSASDLPKQSELYITLLTKKYLADFQRMDAVPSRKDVARCKMLKEKYGKVKHFIVGF